MPLYDFECADCGSFAELVSVSERDAPMPCPHCAKPARRVISAPNLGLMPASTRNAHARIEKSQHEPAVRTAHTCGRGCGCGKSAAKPAPGGVHKHFGAFQSPRKNNRPWMLGH